MQGARLNHLLNRTRRTVLARDTSAWGDAEAALLAGCHSRQKSMLLDPGRRVAALVPRGGGKTTAVRARIVRRMLQTPRARCLFIATTRTAAEKLIWGELKDITEKLGIEATFYEQKLLCRFERNGATCQVSGADDKREIEKFRGQPFHEVVIDEAGSHRPHLLDHLLYRILGPRMGDYGGTITMIGTPSHILRGPFYDVTRPGSELHRKWQDRDLPEYDDWSGWSFHQWGYEDVAAEVPAIASVYREALVEKEANGWSDDHPVWLREYCGQWAADDTEHVFRYQPHVDGQPWNQWEPPRVKGIAELPKRDDWQFVYGMDLGHSDPFALEVFAYSPTSGDRTLYHVYEFTKRGLYAKSIAELLIGPELDAERPRGVIGRTGWPTAMVADTAGLGGALLEELANVYGIRVTAAEKKSKHDAIELFNGDLIDGRIRILKGSTLEEQLQSLQWAEDQYGVVKEDKSQRNDCTDAAIYARRAAMHQFPDEPVEVRPEQQSDPADMFDDEPAADAGEFGHMVGDGMYWGDF